MTFKRFKELLKESNSYGKYVGLHRSDHVFFFDWKKFDSETETVGFKYAVAADISTATKAEVLNCFYKWIIKGEEPPYYIRTKIATTDKERFKRPLLLNW